MEGAAQQRARSADRDGRRSRRLADGEVLRRRHADAGGAAGGPQARHRRRAHLPGAVRVGHGEHRHAAADGRDRRLRAVAGGARTSPSSMPRARKPRRSRRRTPAPLAAFVWKTVADPFAGRITMFRVISGTLKSDSTVHNVTRDTAGAARQPGAAAGQDPDRGAGDQGRRPRRGGEAEGVADERPARRQVVQRSGWRRSSSRKPVISYAIEPKSRGDEEKISTSLHRLQEEDPDPELQPRRADQGAAAVGPGAVAHRGRGGEAEAPLRRRGEPEAAAHSLSRDDRARPPKRTAATRNRPAATASSGTAR